MRACPFRSAPTRDSRSADPVPVSAGARFPDKFATPPALRPGVSVFRGGIRGGCGAGSERAFRPGGRPAFSGGFCPERFLGGSRTGEADGPVSRESGPDGRKDGGVPVRWHSLKPSFGTGGEGLSGRLSGDGARCPDIAWKLPGMKPELRADRPNDFSFRGPDCLGVSARISARVPVAAFRAGRWLGRKRSRCRFLPRPCRRGARHLTAGWL